MFWSAVVTSSDGVGLGVTAGDDRGVTVTGTTLPKSAPMTSSTVLPSVGSSCRADGFTAAATVMDDSLRELP